MGRFGQFLCLAVVIGFCQPATADHYTFTSEEEMLNEASDWSEQFREKIQEMLEALAEGEYDNALDRANEAEILLQGQKELVEHAASQYGAQFPALPKVAAAATKGFNLALADLNAARNIIQNDLMTKSQKVAAAGKPLVSEGKTTAKLQNYKKKTLPRLTLSSNKVDINAPGAATCWKIGGLPKNY